MIKLTEKYIMNIKFNYKEKGEEWLENLTDLIAYCENRWKIHVQEPFELSFNFVAAAIMENRTEVVLKLSVPSKDFLYELKALKLFTEQNRRIVRLLDFDLEKGIILLERLKPGKTLASIENDVEATRITANVLKKLWIPTIDDGSLPTTKDREQSLVKIQKNNPNGLGPISTSWLQEAEGIFKSMHELETDQYLLHGDLHHYNILSNQDSWIMIDPKGLIGEREYDLIQFLLNKLPESNQKEVIKRRIEIFVEELGLNKERILKWGVCHSILSTSWSVYDNGEYDKSFFQGIVAFKSLYHEFVQNEK